MSSYDGFLIDDFSFDDGLMADRDFYLSPEGYRIMTEDYLIRRGYCCANGCRHCPYWPRAMKGNTVLRRK